MLSQIQEIISGVINGYFIELLETCVQWLAEVVAGIISGASNVLDLPIIDQGILYAQGIASCFLVVKVAFEAFHTWILYSNGDQDADPQGLLVGTAKAAAVIWCLPWGVKYLYQLGTTIATDVAQLGGISGDAGFGNIFVAMSGLPLLVIAALVGIVLLIIIYIQTFIRAATLGMLVVIGPILAVQQVGGGELFSMWLKELVVVCFSQAIQIFMIMAAAYAFTNVFFDNPMTNGLMLLGWLWATVKAPATLRQMLYSSGIGSTAGNVAQTAGTMVIVRKMMTRGA